MVKPHQHMPALMPLRRMKAIEVDEPRSIKQP